MIILPATLPSQIVLTYPKHPHVSRRSTGGGETRIKLSNVKSRAILQLVYTNVETAELYNFFTHWTQTKGTAREFQIREETLLIIAPAGRAQLVSMTWKYAAPPTCVDICGGSPEMLLHTIKIGLVSQPRRVAAYINPTAPELSLPVLPSSIRGGIVTARGAIVGGLINTTGGLTLPGAVLTTGQVWVAGGKFSTALNELPGADISATAQVNAATPTASAAPAAMGAGTSVEGGKFILFGNMPGGALTAGASVTGGMLTIPARNIGGAAITAAATLAPGHYGLEPPGGALSAGATMVGGSFQATQNGAALTSTASVVGGSMSGGTSIDEHFDSVSLLLHFEGTTPVSIFPGGYKDSSNKNLVPQGVNNGPVISTAQSKFGSKSILFNGVASQFFYAQNSVLLLPSDYTIEAFVYLLSNADMMLAGSTASTAVQIFRFNENGAGNLSFRTASNQVFGPVSAGIQINQWYHVRATRENGITRLSVAGQQIGGDNSQLTSSFYANRFGSHGSQNPYPFHGYVDEIRITKGVARPASFTPPTEPFPDS